MTLDGLPARDRDVLGACVRSAVNGPYFPDWEFHTLMGLSREEMAQVAHSWPALPSSAPSGYSSASEMQQTAIANSANWLLGYPHGFSRERLEEDVGYSLPDIARALARWRGDAQLDPSGKGFFDRLA